MRGLFLIIILVGSPLWVWAQGETKTIDLKWGVSEGALSYQLEIARDRKFYYVYNVLKDIKDRHLTLTLPAKEIFFFRVAGVNNRGMLGPYRMIQASRSVLPQPIESKTSLYHAHGIDYAPSSLKLVLQGIDTMAGLEFIEYSLDGGEWSRYTTAITFSSEGRHIVSYFSVDAVENRENKQVYSVIIDDTPPTVGWRSTRPILNIEGIKMCSDDCKFILFAEDKSSGVAWIEYSIDSEVFKRYSRPFSLEGGEHIVSIRATDNVGNSCTPLNESIYIDSTPPRVEIFSLEPMVRIGDVNYSSVGNEFMVRAQDKDSGIKEILVSLDEGKFRPYMGSISFKEERTHNIVAKVFDKVGNVSLSGNYNFFTDATPPRTTMVTNQ